MVTQDMLEWKVFTRVKTEELEKTLNWLCENDYDVDKYERLTDEFDGIYWIVTGFRVA